MMNSDIKKQARETIDLITAKLDHGLLQSRFDEPIAKVAREFEYQAKYPLTHKEFNKAAADFVKQIYEKALGASWMLTDPLAEAIFLLDSGYQCPACGPGYVAALRHANDTENGGLPMVLADLAELIKDIERQKYVDGVFTWYLHRCSWELQCEIAGILLEDYEPFIPPPMRKYVSAQLVDDIPEVIARYMESDFALQQITFRGQGALTPETLRNWGML